MLAYLHKLLGASGLAPHGFCLLWDPALIWTHVVADALIGLAYFSIPVVIAVFVSRRPDVQFKGVAWLFAAFIMACGTTHFMSIWTLWYPDYGPEALIKLLTAAISVATAVALWPLLPQLIALPSPAELQRVNADLSLRINERDTALAALAIETSERQRAEAMLRQAQTMKAVGQLSGGIAHDFNNLLAIIIANVDRARRFSGDTEKAGPALENALAGAQRAAQMTDQLLAFARRQPLQAERQQLNTIVERVHDQLVPSLETAAIVTRFDLDPALWPVEIDTAQTENALINLIVNARDAMEGGGTLELVSRNNSGADGEDDTVVLEIRDSGSGMDIETRERAFEPFFTTKSVGQGTGLGLSQAYGFIHQSRGEIEIDSTPGSGTCVRITLPRAIGEDV